MTTQRSQRLAATIRQIVLATIPLSGIGVACGSSESATSATDGGGAGEGGSGGEAGSGLEGGGRGEGGGSGCDPAIDSCQCRFSGPTTFYSVPIATCPPEAGTVLDASLDADCVAADAGQLLSLDCARLCGANASQCNIQPGDGGYVLGCVTGCMGRVPEGLAVRRRREDDPTARWLAEVAYLEAASVDAFAILSRELSAHGAPTRLVCAARRAERDERRHARVMGRLARRAGARSEAPRVKRGVVRSLERLALENAVEGCVRETYGALLAQWQTHSAADAHMRDAMKAIAADETRHAELAWAVARWAEPRLLREERRRVHRARREAWRALETQLTRSQPRELQRIVGLPMPNLAVRMMREIERRSRRMVA
jgi:hypothetical protein